MKGTLLERNDLMALFEFNKEILEKCSLQTPFYQENYLLIEWLFQLRKIAVREKGGEDRL